MPPANAGSFKHRKPDGSPIVTALFASAQIALSGKFKYRDPHDGANPDGPTPALTITAASAGSIAGGSRGAPLFDKGPLAR